MSNSRDIILYRRQGEHHQRISDLHPFYPALHYVLLFPKGQMGWNHQIPYVPATAGPGSNSQEMTILACGNFWPIAFIHAQMNPVTSSSLESSFLNIWWTPGPFASSSTSTTSVIIQRSFAWSSIQTLGEQWSRTLSLISLRLEQELSSPPLSQAVQGICRPPVRMLLL